ncbi:Uncharacterised protein [Legionella busanensis]|uniref:Uncharacterized protein n=1 Tax=Legionella busanensis TaxID=190655 RepID=A0A378KBF1_9GAMM|nr:Uncharacterised protein [Legionella busanensis]
MTKFLIIKKAKFSSGYEPTINSLSISDCLEKFNVSSFQFKMGSLLTEFASSLVSSISNRAGIETSKK